MTVINSWVAWVRTIRRSRPTPPSKRNVMWYEISFSSGASECVSRCEVASCHVRCHNYSFQRGAPHTLLIAVDAEMCIAAASPVNGSNRVVRSTSCSHTANSSKERPTRQSVVCSKRGICRKSCYHCKHGMLKPALWLEPCCELYHTKPNC